MTDARDRRWTVTTTSPKATRELGRRLAGRLKAGDVVLLYGDLGSGKTTLAQGICCGLGVDGWANSPTFTLINEYRGRLVVYHCDFYRIADPGELATVALDEALYGGGVALVEWPEVAEGWTPPDAIRVRITAMGPRKRAFEVEGIERMEG